MRSFKRHLKLFFWSALAIGAGIYLGSLVLRTGALANSYFTKTDEQKVSQTEPAPELVKTEIKNGPTYLIRRDAKKPSVSAQAYLVGDLDSGEIVLEKNKEVELPIASISKLMTALVSLSSYNQSGIARPSARALATYGKNGGLRVGEKIELRTLLYPLLLESSNDAAEVISEYSNRSDFIAKMNEYARNIGMEKTRYVEPTGLSAENQSTVFDLFKLTSYIKKNNNEIFQITAQPKYSSGNHTWYNISQFLREKGYVGSKSGFIDESRQTNVGLFSLPLANGETKNLAVIVLKSNSRLNDTKALLKFVKENVYYGDKNSFPFASPSEDEYRIPDDEIELAFVGDIMLGRGIATSVDRYFGGNARELFRNVPELKLADIAFGNLEGPASDKGSDSGSIYSFRMAPGTIGILKDAGFDALSFANNHVGDWGREAFADTLDRLALGTISAVGTGTNRIDAKTPKIIEKKGMKVGFLGFSDVGPNWLAATDSDSGILLASDPNFDEIISTAAQSVDTLVVSFHWGEEYSTEHTERQEMLAHRAIEDGAKIIIGSHPHVVQDTENYKGGVIAYSLGNFIFDQAFSKDTRQGMLFSVRLRNGEVMHVEKKLIQFNPTTFQPERVIEAENN